jgi:RHS repeat-associated protein
MDSYMELIEMGVRRYDPQLGRFISPDTIIPDPQNPQSFNRYSYVRNNPVKYQDPTGHSECVDRECEARQNTVNRNFIGLNTRIRRNLIYDTARGLRLQQTQGTNRITDLEATARLVDFASTLYSGNNQTTRAQFVDDVASTLTGLEGTWPEHSELTNKWDSHYRDFEDEAPGPFGQTGFAPIFQDPGQGGNQPHHFWFYAQIGYHRTWVDADKINLLMKHFS